MLDDVAWIGLGYIIWMGCRMMYAEKQAGRLAGRQAGLTHTIVQSVDEFIDQSPLHDALSFQFGSVQSKVDLHKGRQVRRDSPGGTIYSR